MRTVQQAPNAINRAPSACSKDPTDRRAHNLTAAARARRAADKAAIQADRRRIAHALHDGLTQDLASLALRCDLARRLLAGSEAPQAAELRDHLETISSGLQHAVREARAVVYALRAPDLDGRSVEGALLVLAARFEAQTGVPVDVMVEGDPPDSLDLTYELTLFRLAEEALNNVRLHAAAYQVTVRLAWQTTAVCLSVQDDGLGFDVALAAGARAPFEDHFGLLAMRERVAALHGELLIDSHPHGGTLVSATFALPSDAA
jgi:signal transduction histidine kinase